MLREGLYYNFSNGVQNKSDSASITLVGENGARAALHENKTVYATKYERDIDEGYIASLVLLKEDELLKQAVDTVLKMEIEKKNEKRHYSYYSALAYIYENGVGVNKDEDKAFAYACLSMELPLVMPFFKSEKRKYPGDDLIAPVERDSPKYYLLGKTLLNDGLKEYGEKLIEMGAKNIDFEEGDYTPRGDHQPHKINNELEKHYQMLLHQEFANICFNRITIKPNGYDIGDLVVHYACYLAYKIYGHDKMINYPTSEMDGDPYDHTWDDVQKTDFFEAYRFLKKCGEEGDEFAKLVVSIYDLK